ncbi:hypothetical protein Tcan_11646 [Toxocara canis]|uniref:EB domain-containing protein n=1 Tax=Toxocara canis TaxID=6265 RepID=A0A0B2VN53_TOXCA|nr:hypothetical protein Tcan_11646 [Toxocara canis]
MQSLGNGAPCLNDYGCSLQANGYRCYSGTCCIVSNTGDTVTPVCRAPNEAAEMQNGRPKNCLYTSCSIGYTCEFSYAYNGGQYLCCGKPSSLPIVQQQPPTIYGVVQIYPSTGAPVQCNTFNSCLAFNDTPNCVYSSRFGIEVCCSTLNC